MKRFLSAFNLPRPLNILPCKDQFKGFILLIEVFIWLLLLVLKYNNNMFWLVRHAIKPIYHINSLVYDCNQTIKPFIAYCMLESRINGPELDNVALTEQERKSIQNNVNCFTVYAFPNSMWSTQYFLRILTAIWLSPLKPYNRSYLSCAIWTCCDCFNIIKMAEILTLNQVATGEHKIITFVMCYNKIYTYRRVGHLRNCEATDFTLSKTLSFWTSSWSSKLFKLIYLNATELWIRKSIPSLSSSRSLQIIY